MTGRITQAKMDEAFDVAAEGPLGAKTKLRVAVFFDENRFWCRAFVNGQAVINEPYPGLDPATARMRELLSWAKEKWQANVKMLGGPEDN